MLKICGDVLKGHPQKSLFLFPKAIFFLIPAQTKPPVPAIGFPLLFSLKKCVFESVYLLFYAQAFAADPY